VANSPSAGDGNDHRAFDAATGLQVQVGVDRAVGGRLRHGHPADRDVLLERELEAFEILGSLVDGGLAPGRDQVGQRSDQIDELR